MTNDKIKDMIEYTLNDQLVESKEIFTTIFADKILFRLDEYKKQIPNSTKFINDHLKGNN